MSNSLLPHESQHARPPCPSPTPGVYSNSCPSSRWCHPAISSSVVPFSSCPQSHGIKLGLLKTDSWVPPLELLSKKETWEGLGTPDDGLWLRNFCAAVEIEHMDINTETILLFLSLAAPHWVQEGSISSLCWTQWSCGWPREGRGVVGYWPNKEVSETREGPLLCSQCTGRPWWL